METADVTVVNIFGGSFFGNLITALCFGVLTIQAFSYYHAFPNDGRPLKLAVRLSLYVLEICIRRPLSVPFSGGLFMDIGSIPTCVHYSSLYIGGSLQITIILWLRGGRRGAYWVSHAHGPFLLSPMKSLHIHREFLIYQINTSCASVTVQTFFAHGVYSLSANLYVGVLVQVWCFFSSESVPVGTHLHMSQSTVTYCISMKLMLWRGAVTAIKAYASLYSLQQGHS
ncbi:hypothetical protein BS47DRAFT_1402893 [Hydnum rufescens UP504]|uniref:Uncharacterized protein n=1 Tax=Hydnum rufescens UP504 TaxID=1448309 RepID=A0A9P6ADJ1_9AGAM|nr:hypothetical protein BS47DRAFT_1402893 [Hydnum rufescens UP504]